MKFSIALGKTAKGVIKILGGAVDADKARRMVDNAGNSGSIIEGYVISNPDRSLFRYRRNFEAPPPPQKPIPPVTPLSATELAEKRFLESLGASFGEVVRSEDLDAARESLAVELESLRQLADALSESGKSESTAADMAKAESAEAEPVQGSLVSGSPFGETESTKSE